MQNLNILQIKTDFEDLDYWGEKELEDKKAWKLRRIRAGTNRIEFAELFLECFDVLSNNAHLTQESLQDELKKCIEIADELRILLEDYHNDVGKWFAEERIKDSVKNKREVMSQIIVLFSQIFLQEE